MTAPTGGTGGATGGTGSANATVRGVHTPRPIGSIGVRPGGGKPGAAPSPKKPAKPVKKGRK